MPITFQINDLSNPKAKAFLEFLKTLDFVTISKEFEYPTMSEKEIIDQAIVSEKEIEYGDTISHNEFYKAFKKW